MTTEPVCHRNHPIDVAEFLKRHLVDVFATMLSLQASPSPNLTLPNETQRVTGSVGFAGETINGVVYLHLSAGFALNIAAAMLGLSAEEGIAEDDINDVVGEVTNMLAGGLKSALCDANCPCAVSTPSIIRGNSFMIEPVPESERIWLGFECAGERAVVEVHLQGN